MKKKITLHLSNKQGFERENEKGEGRLGFLVKLDGKK